MSLIDISLFRQTPLVTDPFDFCIVKDFVRHETLARLRDDFPAIEWGGSYPLSSLSYGPVFDQLCHELLGEEMRAAFAEKFDLDLEGRPATLTVRGRTRQKDGRIHLDSKTKLITVLLYLNGPWEAEGGRLRLLRSPDNLNDFISEVTPDQGTLVAFRCAPNAWHGHAPFEGERRSIQLNWVVDGRAANKSQLRHRASAWLKAMNPFASTRSRAS